MNKSIKIVLVSANQHIVPYPVYPLGVSYLKTYMHQHIQDADILIFDCLEKSYEQLNEFLVYNRPDFIGISLRNIDDVNIYRQESFINHYKRIIEVVRKASDAVVVIGGPGFSIYPQILYKILQPDYGIYGEGEASLSKLITSINQNTLDPKSIDGLVYSSDEKIIVNTRKNSIHSLALDFEDSLVTYYWEKSGMLNIQTKRGCPFECIYCTYPLIEGKDVRKLDIDKIIETLSKLYFDKGIDYVFFTDSIFNIFNEYNYELAERIIESKIKIKWGAYFTVKNLDQKLLSILKRAGLTHIEFGTDSISDKMLNAYNKPFNVSDILRISKLCNDLEIDFAHFLILGGLGETEKTLSETFENSKLIHRSVFFPFIGMRIYPGTKLYTESLKQGIITSDQLLIEPAYYLSPDINIHTLKINAIATGQSWVFPDDDKSIVMNRLRIKNKKGPLWEYLIKL